MSLDLHTHSHFSDGTWSPTELVNHAISLNMKHIALTDHDTTDGINEAIESAKGMIEIIPALEINTIHKLPDGRSEDVHILGYFIDKENKSLKQVLQKQQDARRVHVCETIEKVRSLGINLDMHGVQRFAGLGSVGKAHITQAIVAAGGAPDITSAYEQFMCRGSQHYVQRRSVTPQEAIQAINTAGGIASIAHPGQAAYIDELILALRDCGLQGIEAFHRVHSLERVRHFIRLAHRNNLVVTGGSDCHGPFEDFASTIGSISVPSEVLTNLRIRYSG
jgi:predicted metal-dependent phosphoesterase TrpH